jgi:hypothetical protein
MGSSEHFKRIWPQNSLGISPLVLKFCDDIITLLESLTGGGWFRLPPRPDDNKCIRLSSKCKTVNQRKCVAVETDFKIGKQN